MREHQLKTWPQYFERIISGQKNFEVRKNDRDFQVGDILILNHYDPDADITVSAEDVFIRVKITYILHGPGLGIEAGYCVMGIEIEEHGFGK